MPVGPYPAAPPTVTGTNITMEMFLKNPTYVQRAVTALTNNRFLADQIFAAGPTAVGGAVLFDQLLTGDYFTARDVQAIEPGSEFPILNDTESAPQVAAVTKWGGAALYTDENIRRDRRDLLAKGLIKLRNTTIRKVDTVAMAVLEAAAVATTIPSLAASADWSTTGDIIGDIETARSMIDNADLEYTADTVVLNTAQALDLRKDTDIRAALPRENMSTNMLGDRSLSGFLGIPNWIVSNRATAGNVWVLAGKTIGSISDELPLYSRVVEQPLSESKIVMAARVCVPYITDPLAGVRITGA